MTKLSKNFYNRKTSKLAMSLLGKYLVRKYNGHILMAKIAETEMYYGQNDKASHASRGKTNRTRLMFDQPGLAYVYQIYGMYYCLNIVTEKKDFPAAILIRAAEPIKDIEEMAKNRKLEPESNNLTNGPSKICQALKIDKKLNGENLITSTKLYLMENKNEKTKTSQIVKAKRIGIDYAQEYKDKLWRFYLKDNKYVSKK